MIGRYLRVAAAVARKDLLVELRSRRRINGATVLALLIVVVFSFVFVRRVENAAAVARGGLWIALVFAAVLGLTRGLAVEETNAAIEGLMLAPVDRSAIFLGKVASSVVFVTVIGWVDLAAVAVFLDDPFPLSVIVQLLAVFPLAALGFSAVGVLLTMVTLNSQLQESILPLLLVPLVVPVILAGIELTRPTTGPGSTGWFRILLVYDGLVLVTGWVSFGFVLEE
jgi:heme exporter protein B